MSNINGYPEKCDCCGQKRTCNGAGLCHECQQAENEKWDEIEGLYEDNESREPIIPSHNL